MKILRIEYQRVDCAGGEEDYLQGGTIHEGRRYEVPRSGLCRGETIYKGGLYMKAVRMEYQRANYVGGRLSTENNPWDFTVLR